MYFYRLLFYLLKSGGLVEWQGVGFWSDQLGVWFSYVDGLPFGIGEIQTNTLKLWLWKYLVLYGYNYELLDDTTSLIYG